MPYKLKINTPEQFWASLIILPNGCMEGLVHNAVINRAGDIRRLPSNFKCLEDMTGEKAYHRASYRIAYPDVCIKKKSLVQTCGNSACCNPDHLRIGYDFSEF
jgi:hypothetical protein